MLRKGFKARGLRRGWALGRRNPHRGDVQPPDAPAVGPQRGGAAGGDPASEMRAPTTPNPNGIGSGFPSIAQFLP